MERVELRANNQSEADCLERELATYDPQRSDLTVSVELTRASTADLFALLTAIDTCLRANGISGVRVEVDGRAYLLAPEPAA